MFANIRIRPDPDHHGFDKTTPFCIYLLKGHPDIICFNIFRNQHDVFIIRLVL